MNTEVTSSDATNPSSSPVGNFKDLGLAEPLLKAIEDAGYTTPTPIQAKAIPLVLKGGDLLAGAQTGTGKTAGFTLPILHLLSQKPAENPAKGKPRCLILTPTRELAAQIAESVVTYGKHLDLKSMVVFGGVSINPQINRLSRFLDILVATPGRLLDLANQGKVDLSGIEILVLDEADRMLDMGFAEDMEIISGECNEGLRQTLLFSATLHHKGIARVAAKVLDNPMEITTATVRDKHDNISQQIILADDGAHKDRLLSWLLSNDEYEKAIIFTNTRIESERLNVFLRQHSCRCAVLHGELSQDQRNATMQLYREGKINVLVATDVASRGLDVKCIDLVVNYDMARKGDDYVHRIGRTGRAGETGTAISLMNHTEWNLKAAIERYIKQEFEPRAIKELKGAYSGPKRLKASGKAAGSKKKKAGPGRDKRPGKGGIKGAPAVKKVSAKKANGPRPSRPKPSNLMDSQGFAPIKKKKNPPAPKSSQDD